MNDEKQNVIENPQVIVSGFLERKISKIKAKNDLEGLSGLDSLEHESHQEAEIQLYEDALDSFEKGDSKPLMSVMRSLYADDKYFVEVTHKDSKEEDLQDITKKVLLDDRNEMQNLEKVFQVLGTEVPTFSSESEMHMEAGLNNIRIYTKQLMIWGRDPKYHELLVARTEDKNWLRRLMDFLATLAKSSESIRKFLEEMGKDVSDAISEDERVQTEEPIVEEPKLINPSDDSKHE